MASGLVKFPTNPQTKKNGEDIYYEIMLELFIRSPKLDDTTSDGNRLYLAGGWVGNGSLKLDKNLLDKSLSSILKSPLENYRFFIDTYIVARSPYSDQFLILRVGLDKLFGTSAEKANMYFSTIWEFPSILSWSNMFEEFKMVPYISSHIQIPTDGSDATGLAQAGIKVSGEAPGREIDVYGQLNYDPKAEKPWTFFCGVKFSL